MDDLEKVHRAILYIAKEINRVCEKNNICYTLVGGSLIGAIRHKGFIPWDDDMDIGMTRVNYEEFIRVCATDLGQEFELQTFETDPNYNYGFAKILLKGTDLIEFGHENTREKKGIFVDIFPFDAVPSKQADRKKHEIINYTLIKLLQQKTGVRPNPEWSLQKKMMFCFLYFMSMVISRDFLINKLQLNMIRYNTNTVPKYYVNLSGMYGYMKETVEEKCFSEYYFIDFEDTKLMITKEYDCYLKNVFGDYMKLPPVEQRRTHGFKKINFGDYDFEGTDAGSPVL